MNEVLSLIFLRVSFSGCIRIFETLITVDFSQSSFPICCLRQHSSSAWEGREGGLYFPASLPQTLAAESPVRQREWSRSNRVSKCKACQPRVTSTEKGSTSPLLLCSYYCTFVYIVTSVPIASAFIAIAFPWGQHNSQICYLGYSSIPLGTLLPSIPWSFKAEILEVDIV